MRRAAARDHNEPAIVDALRAAGASVCRLSDPGCPDLLVGYRGMTLLMEVKVGRGPQHRIAWTAVQREWHAQWRGAPVHVVQSPADALLLIRRSASGST